jgi:hypothetical protein
MEHRHRPACLGGEREPVSEDGPSTEDGAISQHPDGGCVRLWHELLQAATTAGHTGRMGDLHLFGVWVDIGDWWVRLSM